MRPLTYEPTEVILWKGYFGRYVPQIRPTPEIDEGVYSKSHAYLLEKEVTKAKAKELYKNYLAILEAREKSSQCALTNEELMLILEIERELRDCSHLTEL